MHRSVSELAAMVLFSAGTLFPAPCSALELLLADTVSIDGITWKFSERVPVGRFVNGDWYVVGPVTIKMPLGTWMALLM